MRVKLFSIATWLCIGIMCCALWILFISDRLIPYNDLTSISIKGWCALAFCMLTWALALMMPLLLLARWSLIIYFPVTLLLLVLQCVEWFAKIRFGMILDGDCVGVALGSSWDEIDWFFTHYLGVAEWAAVAAALFLAFILLRVIYRACRVRVTWKTVALSVSFAVLFCWYNRIYVYGYKALEEMPTVHLILDSFRKFQLYRQLGVMKNHPDLPRGLHVDESMGDVTGVVVLGESTTCSHMGIYGYERDTTPNLIRRKDELVWFTDLVTPISVTAGAMRYLFTTCTVEKKDDLRFTMAQALRESGYDVRLYSNQSRWGEWEGDEAFDFAGCDPMCIMNEEFKTNCFDEVLLDFLDCAIKEKRKRQVVFLHLRGSHFPCDLVYPYEGAPFPPESGSQGWRGDPALARNHYDNTIWYTDKVLEGVIRLLEKKGGKAWMIFVSDHGETPSAKTWRTVGDPDLWRVPLVVWMSKNFRECHADLVESLSSAKSKPLQSDQLLYGMLHFAGVKQLGVSGKEDFLNQEFELRRHRYIENGRSFYESVTAE